MSDLTIDVKNEAMLGTMGDGVVAAKLYSLEKALEEKDKEIERLNNMIETYKDANEYHQNRIVELEKVLRKSHRELHSENVMLRADNNRLNNIINKLEKFIDEKNKVKLDYDGYIWQLRKPSISCNELKNKLQTLKDGVKE